jgi:putative tryptophan/tyrosine transport system ATP-binding protein
MLQLKDIVKIFPTIDEPVLNGINLELQQGDFCVLIGSNGSGKSTLMKTIAGEYLPTTGTIFLNNQNISTLKVTQRSSYISSVSQDITLGTTGEMTLLENLMLSLMRGKKARLSSYRQGIALLKEKIAALGLGLENYFETPLANLSGGQRQMIATVMATFSEPALLLLDEHCSALDPRMQTKIMEYTSMSIQKQKLTALMITHNLKDAIQYGNRLIMLHQGKIALDLNGEQKAKLTIGTLLNLFQQKELVP